MIKVLEEQDINKVAQLHQEVLGHTLNSVIGNWFLEYLYTQIIQDKDSVSYVYIDNSEIIGFISATLNYKQINNNIFNNLSFIQKVKIAFYFIFHPLRIKQIINQLYFGKYLSEKSITNFPYLLTLGVAKNQQGKKVGSLLLKKIEQYFLEKNREEYYFDTETTNERAISFYKKNGCSVIEEKNNNIIFSKQLF